MFAKRFKMPSASLWASLAERFFIERKPENLRIFRLSLFTGGNWTAKLLARVQSLRARPLPCGELPQQQLRGLEIGVTQKIL
jgi:hypothetical protein